MLSRIERWLGSGSAPWIVIAIAIGLAAPALTASFTADDHLHRVVSRDENTIDGLSASRFDLFVFANGDPHDAAQLRDGGLFPWWTDLRLKLAFWRPLSSATHAFDHALWPDNPTLHLAHNLLWHAIGLVLVWFLYRRFVPVRWIAVLALALYAFDDARGPVVGWIANRNALLALVLAIPALLAHDRWRRDAWRPGRWLGPLAFVVALGAGESAIAILAYIGAYTVWLDRGHWRDRLLALAPYALLLVGWRVVYGHLGYGTAGSGIYLDPGADPMAFAHAVATREPFLLLGQLGLPWSDLASFYPLLGGLAVMLGVAVITIALVGWACARLLARDPVSRFFATGMLLAAVPVSSTFPADRLLTFVGLGAMGLVAQLLAATLRHRDQLGDGRFRRAACVVVACGMFLVHLVLAPPLLVLRSRSMVAVARVVERADAGIPADPAATVIIAAAPSDALAGYTPLMREARHQPRPAHLYWLATATTAVTFERLDERTLRITPDGGFLRYEIDRMMRARPFAIGDAVALTGLTLEIESVMPDGRPRSALAHFAAPLEDARFTWLRWEGHSYVPYAPPAVHGRTTLPAIDFLKLLED
ncbi:MAG: hypothetical protein SFX73_14660 [Kofleriaceae bacterium]|nr:hypothetical protein [Kofleriaceae bacterium]